ncbi:uncharacterized protein LOC111694660 [Trichogramma pretiosum]|uniref:uncharacterized protein LOC111694660 n=1 Tax=Trichogramma pretiosum TaxID=7493 RepID=UPI000C71C4A7|nr:uncharacterized protein LOC111694660 [Trichogramma pretiosum]
MIVTTGGPVSESCRKLSLEKLKAAQEFFRDQDLAERSNSAWASPIHLVEKKDGSWRVCGDYRKLNSVTVPDKYPVKRLQDFSTILFNATVFSTLDLEKAFMQISLRSEDRSKTALTTPFGLFQFKVEFLGFLIDCNGYKPLPAKVEKINNFPRPQTVEQLCRFLGMINFYHHCMPGSAQLQIELNGLLTSQKKCDKTPINWNSKAIESFEQLKKSLAAAAYLAFPQDGAPLRVCTDASDSAMGAVLEQQAADQWKLLAFFSPAQADDDELRRLLKDPAPSFKLCKVVWQPSNQQIFAEVSTKRIRPYVPGSLHFEVFDIFHGLAHPGPRITDKLIRKFYIWPSMSRDITLFCKACMPCQQSKVTRHNRPAPMHFEAPDARFQHVHIDLVGPLPKCRGFSYLLTMIDRFSWWPEAVPLQDITAETVARAFVKHWVSRFGALSILTTDQSGQFESKLFEEVYRVLGIEKIHTTLYHPQANGMIERFHRDIKAAFMCRSETGDRLDALPTIMLGLRTRPILDTDLSPAEMLYGRALRIPGIFCEYDDDDYDSLKHKDTSRPFYYADLDACSHVFKIIKCGKRSLERPYTGPHRVISRDPSKKHIEIQVDNRIVRVSVDQLKPAHFLDKARAHQAVVDAAPPPGPLEADAAASHPVPSTSTCAPSHTVSIDIPGSSTAVTASVPAQNNKQTSTDVPTNANAADIDDALLPDYPELTAGGAADVPLPLEQPSFTSEYSHAGTSQANGKRKARSNNRQPKS